MWLLRNPPNGHMVSFKLTVPSVILLLTVLYFLYILGRRGFCCFSWWERQGSSSLPSGSSTEDLCLCFADSSWVRLHQVGHRWKTRTFSHQSGACWSRQWDCCLKYIFLIYPGSWFWNSWSAQPGDQRHKPRASGVRSAVQCQLPYLVQSLCNKCGWASCLPPGSLHCRIIWRCSCKYSGHDSGGPRSWGGCCTVKNVTNTCLFIVLRIYNFLSNTSKRCLEYRKSFFFKKSLLILIS